jgi:hypothetical protein
MNPLSRRRLLGTSSRMAIATLFAGSAVTACSTAFSPSAVPTIPATVTTAQQESSAILTAVNEFVSQQGTPTQAETTALSVAGTTVAGFLAVKPGDSYLQDAEAVVTALTPLLAFLPASRPSPRRRRLPRLQLAPRP